MRHSSQWLLLIYVTFRYRFYMLMEYFAIDSICWWSIRLRRIPDSSCYRYTLVVRSLPRDFIYIWLFRYVQYERFKEICLMYWQWIGRYDMDFTVMWWVCKNTPAAVFESAVSGNFLTKTVYSFEFAQSYFFHLYLYQRLIHPVLNLPTPQFFLTYNPISQILNLPSGQQANLAKIKRRWNFTCIQYQKSRARTLQNFKSVKSLL